MPLFYRCIEESNRFHRAGAPDKTILVVGIPNVGKSSLINQLRFGAFLVEQAMDWADNS
jgi:GTP-binding protein EngB required for normal cell division